MLKFVIAAVALLAPAGGLAYWAYGPGDDNAEAEVKVIRWVNVTVAVPENPDVRPVPVSADPALSTDSELVISQEFAGTDTPHPFLVIHPIDNRKSLIAIDAETGEITKDTVYPEDRAAIDDVLRTLTVTLRDTETLPWPYISQPPNVSPVKIGNITYIPPDPAAGIRITGGDADPGGHFIEVNTGRSLVFIYVDSGGVVWEPDFLVPEDKEVLERFLSTVQYVGP